MTRVPTSNIAAIPTILMMVKKVMPTSVLDVGIGYGKYGCLIREWLSMEDYLKPKDQWAMRIDGIEVFPQYITPIQQHAYNNIMIGNAVDILPTIERKKYDLLLAVDVLEHFDKEQAYTFLGQCIRVAKNMIIATPEGFFPQAEVLGNAHEEHRSGWAEKEFEAAGAAVTCNTMGSVVALFLDMA